MSENGGRRHDSQGSEMLESSWLAQIDVDDEDFASVGDLLNERLNQQNEIENLKNKPIETSNVAFNVVISLVVILLISAGGFLYMLGKNIEPIEQLPIETEVSVPGTLPNSLQSTASWGVNIKESEAVSVLGSEHLAVIDESEVAILDSDGSVIGSDNVSGIVLAEQLSDTQFALGSTESIFIYNIVTNTDEEGIESESISRVDVHGIGEYSVIGNDPLVVQTEDGILYLGDEPAWMELQEDTVPLGSFGEGVISTKGGKSPAVWLNPFDKEDEPTKIDLDAPEDDELALHKWVGSYNGQTISIWGEPLPLEDSDDAYLVIHDSSGEVIAERKSNWGTLNELAPQSHISSRGFTPWSMGNIGMLNDESLTVSPGSSTIRYAFDGYGLAVDESGNVWSISDNESWVTEAYGTIIPVGELSSGDTVIRTGPINLYAVGSAE